MPDEKSVVELPEGAEIEPPKTAAAPEPEETEEKDKPKGKFSKRIGQLTREKYEERAKREALEERFERLLEMVEKGAAKQPEKSVSDDDPKPNADSFQTHEEYVEALGKWAGRQGFKEQHTKTQATEAQSQEQENLREIWDQHNERIQEARVRYAEQDADYDQIVGAKDVKFPEAAGFAIVESENGPDIAVYYAQHPEARSALLKLSPNRQIMEIGKVSDALTSGKLSALSAKAVDLDETEVEEEIEVEVTEKREMPPAKKQIPAPIKPVKKSSPTESGLSDDLDIDEWTKRRWKQVKAQN